LSKATRGRGPIRKRGRNSPFRRWARGRTSFTRPPVRPGWASSRP
jgi:hypothetical protein